MTKAEVYDANWLVIEIDQGPYSNILEASQVFSTALSYYYDGNLIYAALAFQKALEYDPGMAKAHYLLGNTYYQLGRVVSAVQEYQKALALNPLLTKARINLGAALAEQGNYSDAVTEYETALELEPNNAIANFNLGVALVALEQREQGVTLLNNAKTILEQGGYQEQAEAVEKYIKCRASATMSPLKEEEVFECK
jgi:superkiller protein 3